HLLFDRDRVALDRLVWHRLRGRWLDADVVAPHPDLMRVEDGAAGRQVKFPAMPRAAQDLTLPRYLELVWFRAGDQWPDDAHAQRRALVRAPVPQRVQVAVDIEDADAAPSNRD